MSLGRAVRDGEEESSGYDRIGLLQGMQIYLAGIAIRD